MLDGELPEQGEIGNGRGMDHTSTQVNGRGQPYILARLARDHPEVNRAIRETEGYSGPGGSWLSDAKTLRKKFLRVLEVMKDREAVGWPTLRNYMISNQMFFVLVTQKKRPITIT